MPRLSRSATKGDSERELTDKGLKQAKAVGEGIESLGLVPTKSPARPLPARARRWTACSRPLATKPIVDYRISLYDGGVQAVFDELATSRPRIACS